jgi:hypothetical protein
MSKNLVKKSAERERERERVVSSFSSFIKIYL